MTIAHYTFPTAIDVGAGARHRLPKILQAAGVVRPLIVTDPGVAALPFFAELEAGIQAAGLPVASYTEAGGNPVQSQVVAGVEALRAHQADAVVALGGGAPMDVAKAVALMAHHPGDLFDYEDGKPDALAVDGEIPYLVAIPTTAGTGSEVGRSSVISEDGAGIKRIIFSPRLLPRHVLADPELTLALPAGITAATGMDALCHLVEAYLAPGSHPMCDGIALEGVRLVAGSLVKSYDFALAPDDRSAAHLAAREAMLNAAMMGAVAFQKGLGVTHSCAHAVSALFDVHHGLANGILFPYCMAYNEEAVPERFRQLEAAAGLDPEQGALVAWLVALKSRLALPESLAEVGVEIGRLDRLVEIALADGCHPTNPRPVSAEHFHDILSRAIRGERE